MNTIASAIADLQAKWHTLHSFNRAQALFPIVRAGVSRRYLANALHISEGTIRNLLLILKAGQADLALYRRGHITQNELIRRVRGIQPAIRIANPVSQPSVAEQRPRPIRKIPPGITPMYYLPLIRRPS